MTEDKWQDILEKIKTQFEILNDEVEDHHEIPNGKVHTVIFNSPMGRVKVIRTLTPKVLDKKTVYSARAGSDMKVQYEYSKDEMVSRLQAFKWNELVDDWENISFSM